MSTPIFRRLNEDWDAEPNAPCADVFAEGSVAQLTFFLNPWAYGAQEGDKGRLTFAHCAMWRLGATNDEGWYAGQCRYAKIAPAWGAFYELLGADEKRFQPLERVRRIHIRLMRSIPLFHRMFEAQNRIHFC
jgi:hypothetical protein